MTIRLIAFQFILAALICGLDFVSRFYGFSDLLLLGADSPSSYMRFLIAAELLAIIVISLSRLFRKPDFSSSLNRFARAFLLFLMLLSFIGVMFSLGRPILSFSPILPGAVPSRLFLINVDPWLRRLLEPSWHILLLMIFIWGFGAARRELLSLQIAVLNVVAILLLEAAASLPTIAELSVSSPLFHSALRLIHIAAVQGALLFIFAALLKQGIGEERASVASVMLRLLAVPLLICFGVAAASFPNATKAPALIGAHYYLWFPYNWKHGVVGQELEPEVKPALGRYSSDDSAVFRQHRAWADGAGIDYFIFDWWPERKNLRSRLYRHIQDSFSGSDSFKFSIQYETLDLKTSERTAVPGEAENMLVLNEERARRMALNWEHIAKHYMGHPSYLRIDGRPVLYVYASRHLLGDVNSAIAKAKNHVLKATGHNLYLVGDEVFFNVPSGHDAPSTRLLSGGRPDWGRIAAFDAITSYNPYDSSKHEFGGSVGAHEFIRRTAVLYQHYQAVASSMGQLFIPGVLPGYNDRAVRLNEEHYVVPRELVDGSSFLKRMLYDVALPVMSEHRPALAITSWNEWNEGTQIEPTERSEATISDRSESGELFSQAEIYNGYHCQHLEEILVFGSRFSN